MKLYAKLGAAQFTRLLTLQDSTTFVEACCGIQQRLFNAIAKMDRQKEIKPDPEICESLCLLLFCVFFSLTFLIYRMILLFLLETLNFLAAYLFNYLFFRK